MAHSSPAAPAEFRIILTNVPSSTSRTLRIPTKFGEVAAIEELASANASSPVVILLHGFTGWKEEEHIASLAIAFAEAGISTVRFDAPGSGESDGTFYEDYRLTNYIRSIDDVIDWVVRQDYSDRERIGLWGHSMGGFAAFAAALANSHRVSAVCGCQASLGKAGVTEQERAEWERSGIASFAHDRFPKLDLPYGFYLDRDQYDLLEVLPDLRKPTLFIAGTRDTQIPADDVRKCFEIANEPKSYREFNVDHFYKKSPRQCAEINTVVVEFFQQNLSGERN